MQQPKGNDHNERGTLVGESGNRKIQKKQTHWGLIQVSSMSVSSRIFLIGYSTEAACLEFCRLLDFIYESAETILLKTQCLDVDQEEITVYWVILKLGFNIGFQTIADKFGVAITKSIYFIPKTLSIPFSDEESVCQYLKSGLEICFKHNSNLTTLSELIEKEQKRPQAQVSQNRKRKLTFH